MSRVRHDSVASEALAEEWHRMGLLASLVTGIVSVGGFFWHMAAIRAHRAARKDLEQSENIT